MFNRPGPGLYALLEATGVRELWSIGMLNFGCVMIVLSYFWLPKTRLIIYGLACILWAALLEKFVSVNLWGASIQACVVIFFALSGAINIARYVTHTQIDD